jgi:hypothetical protein
VLFLGHPHYNNNSKNAPTFPNFEKFLVSHKTPIFCTLSKTPRTFQPVKIASYKYFWDALHPRARLESHTRTWSVNFMFFENIRNIFICSSFIRGAIFGTPNFNKKSKNTSTLPNFEKFLVSRYLTQFLKPLPACQNCFAQIFLGRPVLTSASRIAHSHLADIFNRFMTDHTVNQTSPRKT